MALHAGEVVMGAFQLIPEEVAGWLLFAGLIGGAAFWPYVL